MITKKIVQNEIISKKALKEIGNTCNRWRKINYRYENIKINNNFIATLTIVMVSIFKRLLIRRNQQSLMWVWVSIPHNSKELFKNCCYYMFYILTQGGKSDCFR